MTGLLQDVMHERADSLDAPHLDVAAIIRDAEQRRARRFRTVAGGLVAASLVVAAGAAYPALRPDEDRRGDAATGVHSYDVAYAVEGTIHDGPRTVDTDLRIAALVQGISGYVVADVQQRVHTVVDGETTVVGRLARIDRPRLVSDDDVVAWVDAGGTLSVVDLATGDRADAPLEDWPGDALIAEPGSIADGQARVVAVDGRTVYVADARGGVMAWDALDGEEPVLVPGPAGVEARDVKGGRILHAVRSYEPQERDGTTTMVEVVTQRIGTDLDGGRSVPGAGGLLSPDGRSLAYVERGSVDGVSLSTTSVGDVDGDRWTPVTSAGHDGVVIDRWLDADTFMATGYAVTDEFLRSDLLSCEASTGTCTTVRTAEPGPIVLATGVPSW